MLKYKSLHQYLDNHLPGSWTIWLRDFFSFLPFITPVEPQMVQLRTLVDKAKTTPNSYDYVNYFSKYVSYFSRLFSSKSSYMYSDKEYEIISISNTNDSNNSSTAAKVSRLTSTSSDTSFRVSREPSTLEKVNNFLKKDDWQSQLQVFLPTVDLAEKVNLTKGLLSEMSVSRNENKKQCLLYIVDHLTLEREDLKKLLFNDLQTEISIKQYTLLLQIRSDIYTDELLTLIDSLRRKKAPEEQLNYGVQRDYNQLTYNLRGMRDGKAVYENAGVLENVARAFETWKTAHSTSDNDINALIAKISKCLQVLKEIVSDFEGTNGLKDNLIREERAARADFSRMEDRQEFSKKLIQGEIVVVSIQRLRELYPEEKSFEKKMKQCRKLGVTVFDAEDSSQLKQALQEHNATKFLLSQ